MSQVPSNHPRESGKTAAASSTLPEHNKVPRPDWLEIRENKWA